jgi:hypothetical protein
VSSGSSREVRREREIPLRLQRCEALRQVTRLVQLGGKKAISPAARLASHDEKIAALGQGQAAGQLGGPSLRTSSLPSS